MKKTIMIAAIVYVLALVVVPGYLWVKEITAPEPNYAVCLPITDEEADALWDEIFIREHQYRVSGMRLLRVYLREPKAVLHTGRKCTMTHVIARKLELNPPPPWPPLYERFD